MEAAKAVVRSSSSLLGSLSSSLPSSLSSSLPSLQFNLSLSFSSSTTASASSGSLSSSAPAAPPKAPPLEWSTRMSIAVPLYRHALHRTKHSIKRTRSLLSILPNHKSDNIRIDPVSIPRRENVLLDGMKPEEAKGSISAEWVEHRPPGVKGCSEDPENERVILFLHGGGFIMGSPLSHRCLTSRFAELAGAKVLAIDYRLAPEHTFPLPLHDAISAYLSLVDPPQTSLSGGKPPKRYRADQIFIAGDSAGGGLSLALSLWLRDYGLNASNPNPLWRQPGGIVALAPWVDLTHSQPSFRLNALIDYLPENVTDPEHIVPGVRSHAYTRTDADNIHPYVSPMFGTDNPIRLTGRTDDDKATLLPPTLIQVGERERLRDEGIVLAAKSFSNSPIRLELYRDMVHVFQVFGDPVGEVALRRAGDFIRNLSVKKTTDAVDEPITSHPSSPGFLGIAPDGEVTELGRVAMMQIVEDGKAEVEVMERKKTIAAEAAAAASWWPLAARGAQTVKPPVALTAAASSIWMGTATRFAGAEDLMGRTEMRMRLPLYRAV